MHAFEKLGKGGGTALFNRSGKGGQCPSFWMHHCQPLQAQGLCSTLLFDFLRLSIYEPQPWALAGLTPAKDPVFKAIGLTCIKDLGEWKYYRRFRLNYSRGLHMCCNCTNCAQAALWDTSETCKCQGWAKAICALAEVESENGSS